MLYAECTKMTDDELILFLKDEGYTHIRKLEEGDFVAIKRLAYSTSVCCGIDESTPFRYRWCFSKDSDAVEFLNNLDEFDDIPKNLDALVGHRYTNGKPLVRVKDARGFDKW